MPARTPLKAANGQQDADPLFTTDADGRYTGLTWGVYGFVFERFGKPTLTKALVLPPRSFTQSEPSATIIQPTQEGGTWVERNGSHLKDISLSGTTGFLPKRGVAKVAGALALLDNQFADSQLKKTSLMPVSGYTEFHTLRSLYREYQNTHRFGTKDERDAAKVYFVNGKDNETWLVEWLEFRLERSSNSPLLYNYSIQLQTIAPGGAITIPPDESAFAHQPTVSSLTAFAARVSNGVNALTSFLQSGLQTVREVESALSNLISIGDTVATGVNSLVSGAEEVLSFPRSILAQTITVGADLDEALANSAVQLPLSVYQACLDLQQDCAHFGSLADDYFAKPWTSRVNALTGNVNKTYGASGDASGQSDAGGGDGNVGGTSSGLGGSGTRNGAREDSPRAGESIQDFALRVCGDATMWGVIAEMNNLRYPYFSQSQQNRADGTLAPGDTCIYPVRSGGIPGLRPVKADRTFTDESVASVNTSTTLVRRSVGRWRDGEWIGYTVKVVDGWGAGQERLITGNTSNTLTVDVAWSAIPNDTSVFTIYKPTYQRTAAAAEQTSFGRDLMVRRQNDGTYDLVRNNNGDVASVTGVPNISQAVELKFVVLKGQLPLHPWYGADMGIGVKGSVEALAQHRLAVEQTILSDTRVKAVRDLSVSFQNGVETVTATLEYVDGRRVPYTSTLR